MTTPKYGRFPRIQSCGTQSTFKNTCAFKTHKHSEYSNKMALQASSIQNIHLYKRNAHIKKCTLIYNNSKQYHNIDAYDSLKIGIWPE